VLVSFNVRQASSGPSRIPQDLVHERFLRCDVRLAISRETRRQITLQGSICVTQSVVSAEMVAEG
jgi:hypothetical protein